MTPTPLHPIVEAVTDEVIACSRPTRTAYLDRVERSAATGPMRSKLACSNLAHGFAASEPAAKRDLK